MSCPDFVKIAEGYCILGLRVKRKEEVIPAIKQAMEHPGPFLINFMVEPEENVYPMIPPGATIAEIIEEPKQKAKAISDSTRLRVSNI